MSFSISAGVVVGYGSIGRYHADLLAERFDKLAIVEVDAVVREQAAAAHPAATVVEDLAALDDGSWPWADSLVAVATWGPSHAALVHELAGRGVTTVLCEKPLATSIADARRLAAAPLRLAVHFHLRYTGFVEGIAALSEAHGLGDPVGMLVDGGARCLVTNGIHYVDLASAVFDERPSSAIGNARGQAINPRSPDLGFYEGTAAWTFPSGRDLTIAFTNSSSIEERLRILYRDATLDADAALDVVLARRPVEDVERFPAVTRTGRATEVLHQGPVTGIVAYPQPTALLLDDLVTGRHGAVDGDAGAAAVEACIAALAAGRDGRSISLPVADDDPLVDERWSIS